MRCARFERFSLSVVILGFVLGLFGSVGTALAADVSWDTGKASVGDEVGGDVGNVRVFTSGGRTLKAAAFQVSASTGLLAESFLSWFDQKDGPYQTAGGGGLGVVGAGESGDEALLDNAGAFDAVLFALPGDGSTYVNFHLNGGGTGTSYSHVTYFVGGRVTDGGGSFSDPFSRFDGLTLATATSGWKKVVETGSTSRDRSINIASDQGYEGDFLLVLAEIPNTRNNTIVDRFAIDKVSAAEPEGCQDTSAPTFATPPDRTLGSTHPTACGAPTPDLVTGLVVGDDCGPVTTTQSPSAGSALVGRGPHLVVITARDAALRVTTAVVRITVEDQPLIQCPGLQTVTADALCTLDTPPVFEGALVQDRCSDPNALTVTQAPPPGTPLAFGDNTVVITVDDGAGHRASCATGIYFVDDAVPTFECPGELRAPTDPGQCSAVVAAGAPSANDNCTLSDLVAVAGVRSDGAATSEVFLLGPTTITWTATDSHQNAATCEQLVTVFDAEAPGLSCPPAIEVATDLGACLATGVELGAATSSDNCPGLMETTNDAGASFALGTSAVTWAAMDAAGLTSTCAQAVTVRDEEAPTMTCPEPALFVTAAGQCFAAVGELGTPVGVDNCDGALTYVNDALWPFGLGLDTVRWDVLDAAHNTDPDEGCFQAVTVLSGASLGFLPPLRGQPVMNKVNTSAQTVPHKVRVTDCAGLPMVTGIIVKLRIEGYLDPVDGDPQVVENVLEEDHGRGEVLAGEAIMAHDGDGQYHFNVVTTAFGWSDTATDPSRWYVSTASVYDAATGALLGSTSVELETQGRRK